MAFDHSDDAGFHAVERELESAVNGGRTGEGELVCVDRQHRETVAVFQGYLLFGSLPVAERKHPLPAADRHPARGPPRRMRVCVGGFSLVVEDSATAAQSSRPPGAAGGGASFFNSRSM